jgi:hypothetical protein
MFGISPRGVLCESGHEGKTYDPEALTHKRWPQRLSEVLGRRIASIDINADAMHNHRARRHRD